MTTKIQKWGNSLAVRLPKKVTARFKLKSGSRVEIIPEAKRIAIKPLPEKKNSLQDLMEKVTKENLHGEVMVDNPRGKEVW